MGAMCVKEDVLKGEVERRSSAVPASGEVKDGSDATGPSKKAKRKAVPTLAGRIPSGRTQCSTYSNELLHMVHYTSVMVGDKAEAAEAMARIMEHSKNSNAALDISGLLSYDRETQQVTQVLEGEADAVMALFDIIAMDPRHTNIKVRASEMRTARLFGKDEAAEYMNCLGPSESWIHQRFEQEDGESVLQITFRSLFSMTKSDPQGAVETMRAISAHAKVKNTSQGITGLLMFDEDTGQVRQILEGPEESVEALFAKIELDPRHVIHDVSRETIKKRAFVNWDMALVYGRAVFTSDAR